MWRWEKVKQPTYKYRKEGRGWGSGGGGGGEVERGSSLWGEDSSVELFGFMVGFFLLALSLGRLCAEDRGWFLLLLFFVLLCFCFVFCWDFVVLL